MADSGNGPQDFHRAETLQLNQGMETLQKKMQVIWNSVEGCRERLIGTWNDSGDGAASAFHNVLRQWQTLFNDVEDQLARLTDGIGTYHDLNLQVDSLNNEDISSWHVQLPSGR